MAPEDTAVKVEADSVLADINSTMADNEKDILQTSQDTVAASVPLWKTMTGTQLQQVEIMEQSVKIAVPQLQELRSRLLKFCDSVPSSKMKIEVIDAALSRKRQCRVTAGAVGPTGMGKSTVWNAVLGYRELLPTDNGQACTSTIIEVLFNTNDDPEAKFEARILFLQASDWESELLQLDADMGALARKDAGEDDSIDVELEARIDLTMEKVRAVYPHIDTNLDFKRTSVINLMKHENVAKLGQELHFTGTDHVKFASSIRKYLVSSVSGGKFAPWPLVKIAQIYVKSDILKDGLVLVDIPGNLDTNAARNALAQEYQKKLSVNCIFSPSKRAASDGNAQAMLNETYQRHMQLDGQWKANRIIFVVARTDESIDVRDHISKNPEVAKNLALVFEKEKYWATRKSVLENDIRIVKSIIADKSRRLRSLEKDIGNCWAALQQDNDYRNVDLAIKRKAGPELLDKINAIKPLSGVHQAAIENILKARENATSTRKSQNNDRRNQLRKQQELSTADGMLRLGTCTKTRACILDRSKMQTAKILEYFKRISKETGNDSANGSLPVVCVSASKYLDFTDDLPPSIGFPDVTSTRIPALKRALRCTTLETRHRNAKATLEEFESVVNSVVSWAQSLDSNYHMSPEQRRSLEENFEKEINAVVERFSQLRLSTTESLMSAIESTLFSRLRPIQRQAAVAGPKISEKWATNLHWATYRATNVRFGDYQSVKHKEPISWNEDLVGAYTIPMIPLWTNLFENKFPDIGRHNTQRAKQIFLGFSESVIVSSEILCPAIKAPLQSLQKNMLQLFPATEEMYMNMWDAQVSAARASTHRRLKPQIQASMTPAYEKGNLEQGKGFKQRIAESFKKHLTKKGSKIYSASTGVLRTALDTLVAGLNKDLAVAPDGTIAQTRDIFAMLLDNHKPTDTETSKTLSAVKKLLLGDVISVTKSIDASLVSNIQVPIEEVEEQPQSYDLTEIPKDKDDESDFDNAGFDEDEEMEG